MPRKPMWKVADYPEYRMSAAYSLSVEAVRTQGNTASVMLAHRDAEQDGRKVSVDLGLPVLPQGRTASFLRACGILFVPGEEVDPAEAVGKVVVVRFGRLVDGSIGIVSFESPEGSVKHESDAATTSAVSTSTAADTGGDS